MTIHWNEDQYNINDDCSGSPDLSPLKCLRSLSWKSITNASELYALRDSLSLNSEHLSTLELDLVYLSKVIQIWCLTHGNFSRHYFEKPMPFWGNIFATTVLRLKPGDSSIVFPFLEALRLSALHFSSAATEMAWALNLTNLRSLKLHNCPDSLELLDRVSKAPQPMRLTSFELVTRENMVDSFPLSNFLESFTGLEEMYLFMQDLGVQPPKDYWSSIRCHKSTLKRLVYHKENDDNLPGRSVLSTHTTQKDSIPYSVENAIRDPPLVDCIGISDSGSSLVSHILSFKSNAITLHLRLKLTVWSNFQASRLEGIAPSLTWKLLHIRWTRANYPNRYDWPDDAKSSYVARHTVAGGSDPSWRPMSPYLPEDLRTFATWAFGPTGLPKLQILASGDFFHKGRFDERKVLLCRRSSAASDSDTESETEPEPATGSRGRKTAPPHPPFRIMRKRDWGLWDGISGGFAMLEACPLEPLMH